MYSVYAIRCKENGKIYVGCTSKPAAERINQHMLELRGNKKTAVFAGTGVGDGRPYTQWQLDFNRFGEGAFEFFLLEENVPYENRRERESYWMDEYKSYDKNYGYNYKRSASTPYVIQMKLPPKPGEEEDT